MLKKYFNVSEMHNVDPWLNNSVDCNNVKDRTKFFKSSHFIDKHFSRSGFCGTDLSCIQRCLKIPVWRHVGYEFCVCLGLFSVLAC